MNRKGRTATSINFAIHIKGSDPELTRAAGELGAYLRDLPYVTMDHSEGTMYGASQMLFSGQVDADRVRPYAFKDSLEQRLKKGFPDLGISTVLG
jgi:hypothetical protein